MKSSPPGKGANILQRARNISQRASLTDFATANPQHHNGRCWMCNIPERDEVHAAHASGVPSKTIYLWLRDECGHPDVTYGKVHNHFQNRHHERTS